MKRTQEGNKEFAQDWREGKNPLFNILNAYGSYDPEIGYCQGMNFIVASMYQTLGSEEDTFYCFVHLMKVVGWRSVFDLETTKLRSILEFLEGVLETSHPEVYDHIMEELEMSLVPIFASVIATIFIYDSPEEVALTILDVFLYDGEIVIVTLLMNMI